MLLARVAKHAVFALARLCTKIDVLPAASVIKRFLPSLEMSISSVPEKFPREAFCVQFAEEFVL